LILAGETPPRPGGTAVAQWAGQVGADAAGSAGGQSAQQVTIISARVDAVVTQEFYAPGSYASTPALPPKLHQAYVVSNRGWSFNAVSAYARSSDLSDRTRIIDTYA
jgi:hypothetical protein